jgi:hypothetical protein
MAVIVVRPLEPAGMKALARVALTTARVWEGVHFRFSDDTAAREGAEVADYDLPRLWSLGLW